MCSTVCSRVPRALSYRPNGLNGSGSCAKGACALALIQPKQEVELCLVAKQLNMIKTLILVV